MKTYTHLPKNRSDLQYASCQCSICGITCTCTPHFDFYGEAEGSLLKCESCLYRSNGFKANGEMREVEGMLREVHLRDKKEKDDDASN